MKSAADAYKEVQSGVRDEPVVVQDQTTGSQSALTVPLSYALLWPEYLPQARACHLSAHCQRWEEAAKQRAHRIKGRTTFKL